MRGRQAESMNEIDDLKRDLGEAAKNYSDAELRQLSREMDRMAEFLLDLHILRHSKSRKSVDFDTQGSESVA
jgi:hypothetical protein